jgi:uncharacterized membrane protein YGL010W
MSVSASAIPARVANRVAADFEDYASAHQTPGNRLCHAIGIPAVVLSVFGLASQLGASGDAIFRPDGGALLWVLGSLFYLFRDWKLAIPFSLFSAGVYFVARAIPWEAHVVIFVFAWAAQFVGHGVFEKKKPAFFRSVRHLMTGPLWLFAKAVGYS